MYSARWWTALDGQRKVDGRRREGATANEERYETCRGTLEVEQAILQSLSDGKDTKTLPAYEAAQ